MGRDNYWLTHAVEIYICVLVVGAILFFGFVALLLVSPVYEETAVVISKQYKIAMDRVEQGEVVLAQIPSGGIPIPHVPAPAGQSHGRYLLVLRSNSLGEFTFGVTGAVYNKVQVGDVVKVEIKTLYFFHHREVWSLEP